VAPRSFSSAPGDTPHVVRGQIPDGIGQVSAIAELQAHPDVIGVFADPVVETTLTCGNSPAVGNDGDVATQLAAAGLAAKGIDGTGVPVAIVDTGINIAHLEAKGRNPKLDVAHSWTPAGVVSTPGKHPVDHGTMCAFDVGIIAPEATLLDHAVLLSTTQGTTVMSGLLSDAIIAYSRLRPVLDAQLASKRALVVSNSWGMFSPEWDFPVGHPGNYSDNPAHPFNVIVASLEAAGADILFAAGNCGHECPDGRCKFNNTRPICGANSHPAVLSVAGVDVKRGRVGYSSEGPGRLDPRKPDISSYTHFKGSGVYPQDSGTSAACPVLAGLVGAIRSAYPASAIAPQQLRTLLFKTAVDLGGTGFDHVYGWGVPDPIALVKALEAVAGKNGRTSKRSTGGRAGRRQPAVRRRAGSATSG
jgi:subtilisin family serine protease